MVLLLCPEISLQSERGCTGWFLIQPATRIWTFLLPWWFCFCFFKTPCGFFPLLSSYQEVRYRRVKLLWQFRLSYWKEKFLSGTSLPKMLTRDAGLGWRTAGGREALQTVPRHWALPSLPWHSWGRSRCGGRELQVPKETDPGHLECVPLPLILMVWYWTIRRGNDAVLDNHMFIWQKWKLTPSEVTVSSPSCGQRQNQDWNAGFFPILLNGAASSLPKRGTPGSRTFRNMQGRQTCHEISI